MRTNAWILLLMYGVCACQTSKKGEFLFSGEPLILQKSDLLVTDTSLLGEYAVIPLELTAQSALKQVDKIFLFGDYIGVWDRLLRALFVFDNQGKFRYEINHRGNGPGEYVQVLDVCLDPVDSCFAFLTAQHSVMFYSYAGDFKGSLRLEKLGRRMALKGEYLYLLLPDYLNYDKQEYSMMAINRRNGKTVPLLKQGIRPVDSQWTEGYPLISGKEAVYYLQRFTNRIYKVEGETCTPLYELELGKFELPDHLLEEGLDAQFFSNEWSRLWSVFSLTNWCELPEGFMLCSNLPGFFYYNAPENALEHFDGILNEEYGIEFSRTVPVEPAGQDVAFLLDEYRIMSRKEWQRDPEYRRKRETPALKELINSLPDDSNPVLFLYSPKR